MRGFKIDSEGLYIKLVSELILDTEKAFKCWLIKFEGVYIPKKYINKWIKIINRQINKLVLLKTNKIWILIENLIQKNCLRIDFWQLEGFKLLIWRGIHMLTNAEIKFKN